MASVSDPDPVPVTDPDLDSGAFWIRIRIHRFRIQGLKKRSKMSNQHKIILLFTILQF